MKATLQSHETSHEKCANASWSTPKQNGMRLTQISPSLESYGKKPSLNITRMVILDEYERIKMSDRRSDFHIIKIIAQKYGYALDQNGSNSFLMKVIREGRQN